MKTIIFIVIVILIILLCIPTKEKFYGNILYPGVHQYYKDSYKYDLFAVCNHSGVTQGGHYTATIKKGNSWYEYNDTLIQPTKKVVTQKSYCLFYKKKNNTTQISDKKDKEKEKNETSQDKPTKGKKNKQNQPIKKK